MSFLQDKIALVTGGAQGLGREICLMFAQNKATVIIADLNENNANKLESELNKKGLKTKAIQMDVSSIESVRDGIQTIQEEYKKLDIVVNNAAIDLTQSIEEITVEKWRKILEVNLLGPFHVSKTSLPLLEKSNLAHIINICSTAAKRAWANASAYHASKWGLLGFSHALHVEGRAKNIKVTAIVAGGMKTPFILERFPEAEPNLQDPKNVAETIKFILSLPEDTVIPEVMVLPMKETSWP